jgi:hypothetical protein
MILCQSFAIETIHPARHSNSLSLGEGWGEVLQKPIRALPKNSGAKKNIYAAYRHNYSL